MSALTEETAGDGEGENSSSVGSTGRETFAPEQATPPVIPSVQQVRVWHKPFVEILLAFFYGLFDKNRYIFMHL